MHQQSRSQACNEPHHVQALMTWEVPPAAFARRCLTILVYSCFLVMFIHTHELFPKPLLISSHLKGILSPALASFRRSEHTRRSLTEKETAVTEKDRQVAELQRQVAELQAKIGGTSGGVGSTGTPPAVPDNRAGALFLWRAKPLHDMEEQELSTLQCAVPQLRIPVCIGCSTVHRRVPRSYSSVSYWDRKPQASRQQVDKDKSSNPPPLTSCNCRCFFTAAERAVREGACRTCASCGIRAGCAVWTAGGSTQDSKKDWGEPLKFSRDRPM